MADSLTASALLKCTKFQKRWPFLEGAFGQSGELLVLS